MTTPASVSNKPWSSYKEVDYTVQQWHNACLIHRHNGPPTNKIMCKLPVYTPDGTLNRNGVHAAAAALAGARTSLIASTADKASAAKQLITLYKKLNEDPPPSLQKLQHSTIDGEVDNFLEHFGVKGMKWGQRKRSSSHTPAGASPEHVRARQLQTTAKKHGTHVLTNKDLEDLNKRLNLEQNYSKLMSGPGKGGNPAIKKGAGWVGGVLNNVGKQLAAEVLKGHAMGIVKKHGLTATS